MHFFQCIEINTKFAQALLDLKKIKGPFYSMKGKNISRMKIDFLFNYTFLNTFDFFSAIEFYQKFKPASMFLIIPAFPFLGSITQSLLLFRIQKRKKLARVLPLTSNPMLLLLEAYWGFLLLGAECSAQKAEDLHLILGMDGLGSDSSPPQSFSWSHCNTRMLAYHVNSLKIW